jgi:hypothetical protein
VHRRVKQQPRQTAVTRLLDQTASPPEPMVEHPLNPFALFREQNEWNEPRKVTIDVPRIESYAAIVDEVSDVVAIVSFERWDALRMRAKLIVEV